MAEVATPATELLEQGVALLDELLGDGVSIGPYQVAGAPEERFAPEPGQADRLLSVKDEGSGSYGVVLVEAALELAPAQVRRSLGPRVRLMHQLMGEGASVLVIAPWLSPRTRAVLDDAGFGYLDLTGNVSFELRRPRILLSKLGAQRDPHSPSRRQRSLAGASAGRVVRLLVDVAPPYRASEISRASHVSEAWVSRVLDAMESQALIQRQRSVVVEVDWKGLLRERAANVDLYRTNTVIPFVSGGGVPKVLELLGDNPEASESVAVTGSVAAQAVAPRAVGGQLQLYVRGEAQVTDRLARQLRLLPVADQNTHAANVVLLRPPNPGVFDRLRDVGGLPHVALSQVALDCLSGNGRMPQEGEALLEYMEANEEDWRLARLGSI